MYNIFLLKTTIFLLFCEIFLFIYWIFYQFICYIILAFIMTFIDKWIHTTKIYFSSKYAHYIVNVIYKLYNICYWYISPNYYNIFLVSILWYSVYIYQGRDPSPKIEIANPPPLLLLHFNLFIPSFMHYKSILDKAILLWIINSI